MGDLGVASKHGDRHPTSAGGLLVAHIVHDPSLGPLHDILDAAFMNRSTTLGTVSRNVNGNAGALLAAGGVAIAQIRYSANTPTAIPTLGPAGIGGLG